MSPWIILCIACAFFFLEIFVPSGAGIGITLALFIYAVYTACVYEGMRYCLVFIPASLVLMGISAYTALYVFRKSSKKNTWILSKTQENIPEDTKTYLHKEAVTVTPLAPSGIILIEGKRVPAKSQGVYIDTGKKVVVIEVFKTYCLVQEMPL